MPPESPGQDLDELARRFAVHRPRLHAIAQRSLGSPWGADDAVQETWLRLQRADHASIRNLQAWLTTAVSRVCIDLIRQNASRREELDHDSAGRPEVPPIDDDPAANAMRADDVALAMHVLLDSLGPLERLALVLHDVFVLPYDEIGPIVERTPAAARQLATRARAKLRTIDVERVRRRQSGAIGAFLDAARSGDFGDLLQLLDPEIELRSDAAALELSAAGADHGAPLLRGSLRGADAVARVFAGRAELARPVLIGGVPAAAYVADSGVGAVYLVTFAGDRIARLDVIADAELLAGLRAEL